MLNVTNKYAGVLAGKKWCERKAYDTPRSYNRSSEVSSGRRMSSCVPKACFSHAAVYDKISGI